jgi:ribose transport system ATP-binding protein
MVSPEPAPRDAARGERDAPVIEFRDITKRFGPIQALSGVSFAGQAGSVHAITGENGAGKSTLMKLLAGVHSPDEGTIFLKGREIRLARPAHARAMGVSTVFQELTLLPNLTIAENLFLGREPRRFGFVDRSAMRRETRAVLDRIGIDLDGDVSCGDLVIAEQHLVEVAKGAAIDADVVIYDEPTAALDAPGVDKLVRLIDEQKRAGKLIFYISHRLDEIFRLCDTTTVLKDGKHVTTIPTRELTRDRLVSLMVGRELASLYPQRRASSARASAAIVVEAFVPEPHRTPVSFDLNRGEIVGLTGLEGQGQREIIRALAGLTPATKGAARKVSANGSTKSLISSVVATASAGVGFIPEDRKSEGLYQSLSIERNIGLGMLRGASLTSAARVDRSRVKALMKRMNVRARDDDQLVSSLSGGNQQKVMIGRWLGSGVDVLLIEEPTRGVDVGAKSEIYHLLREFADEGGAVLITSSELTEHLGLCDRILVMRDGAVVAEMAASEASEESIMRYALMGRAHEKTAQ